MKRYVQKQDASATSAVTQERQEQPVMFPALVVELIAEKILDFEDEGYYCEDSQWFYQGDMINFDVIYTRAVKELISKHRIELLCCRPDVKTAVRSFYKEIKERIIHNKRDALAECDRTQE